MTLAHKQLAPFLARLRVPPPHCAMLPALALIVACSAGVPTGVDTSLNPADAPVVVNPRSLILEANQVSVFKAYAHGVPGDSLVTSIEWTATGGSIALDGTYSSPSTGDFKVVGKRHGPTRTTSDTATVTVVQPQPSITSVVISPDPATVTEQTQQTFSAVGKLSDGSTVAIGVTWTATGGSIDPGGVYTAGTTSGTYRVIAQAASANVADTVPVTVTAPVSSSGSFPNLPSGYTIPTGFSTEFGSTSEGIFSPMYTVTVRDASTYNPGSGVTPPGLPPGSPPLIGEIKDPAGMQSGIAAGIEWSQPFNNRGWSGLYLAGTVQLSSNWVSEPSGVNKVVYAYTTSTGGGSDAKFVLSAQSATQWQVRLQNLEADPKGSARNLSPNLASSPVTLGRWQRFEVQLIMNTPGMANGVIRLWLTSYGSNGQIVTGPVKVGEWTDIGWVASGAPTTWNTVAWNPIWGGNTAGATVPANQYMWMDRLAVGGR